MRKDHKRQPRTTQISSELISRVIDVPIMNLKSTTVQKYFFKFSLTSYL